MGRARVTAASFTPGSTIRPDSLKATLCVEGRDRLYTFCDDLRRAARAAAASSSSRTTRAKCTRSRSSWRGAHGNGVDASARRFGVHPRARAARDERDRGHLVARHRHRAGRGLCQDAGPGSAAKRDVALLVGSPLVAATPRGDGIELVTPHERIRRRHGRQCGRTVRRRGVTKARRDAVHDLSVPRRIRRARAEPPPLGQRPRLSAAARRRSGRAPREDHLGQRHCSDRPPIIRTAATTTRGIGCRSRTSCRRRRRCCRK